MFVKQCWVNVCQPAPAPKPVVNWNCNWGINLGANCGANWGAWGWCQPKPEDPYSSI